MPCSPCWGPRPQEIAFDVALGHTMVPVAVLASMVVGVAGAAATAAASAVAPPEDVRHITAEAVVVFGGGSSHHTRHTCSTSCSCNISSRNSSSCSPSVPDDDPQDVEEHPDDEDMDLVDEPQAVERASRRRGDSNPLGFCGPLGLTADGNIEAFQNRRSVEMEHGRICKTATMGDTQPELYGKVPEYLSPSMNVKHANTSNRLSPLSKTPALDGTKMRGYGDKMLTSVIPAHQTRQLSDEPGKSHLAMMALVGMFFQADRTGAAWGDWAWHNDSPLRAFGSKVVAHTRLGFCEAVGVTADGDVEASKHRRSVELRHGPICIVVTMGYIQSEPSGKMPGCLAPSMSLKLTDIPNGLDTRSTCPAIGWAQMVGVGAVAEINAGSDGFKTGALGDYGVKMLKSFIPADRTRKLSAKLANGRLTMIAPGRLALTSCTLSSSCAYSNGKSFTRRGAYGVQAPNWPTTGVGRPSHKDKSMYNEWSNQK